MLNKQFMAAINQLCVEKNLPKEKVIEAVKAALRTAYRKDYGTKDMNVDVELDEETGDIRVFQVKLIVDDILDPENELTLEQAKKYVKKPVLEEEIRIDVTPTGYGRIAAQSAKQVILQRIHEAEREVVYDNFKEREDELINAQVSKVDRGQVFLEIDRNTILFQPEDRVPREKYYTGQRIKVYLNKVVRTPKGPRLFISRKHPNLVKKLFEFEIPEMKTGVVLIKNVAREAGIRSKIAVASTDSKVDPIGACVGQKGVRIQNIIEELGGEMIDVVQWHEDSEKYIRQALAPAKISVVVLHKSKKVADIYVETDQRPLAIGKHGQNVKLASELTGWEINIRDLAEYNEDKVKEEIAEDGGEPVEAKAAVAKEDIHTLEDLGLSATITKKLEANHLTIEVLKQMSEEDLTKMGGISKTTAAKIVKMLA
jgi:N utilization substance protein A